MDFFFERIFKNFFFKFVQLSKPYGFRHRFLKDFSRFTFIKKKSYEHFDKQSENYQDNQLIPFSIILDTKYEFLLSNLFNILDSLNIDPHHQVLLFSRSNLQFSISNKFLERADFECFTNSTVHDTLNACVHDWIIYLSDSEIDHQSFYSLSHTILLNSESWFIYSDHDQSFIDGLLSFPKFHTDWDIYRFLHSSDSFFGDSWCIHRKVALEHSDINEFSNLPSAILSEKILNSGFYSTSTTLGIKHIPSILFHKYKNSYLSLNLLFQTYELIKIYFSYFVNFDHSSSCPFSSIYDLPVPYKHPDTSLFYNTFLDSSSLITQPKISILIPTRDRLHFLQQTVLGILHGTDYPSLEVIIIDNGSVIPETLVWLEEIQQSHMQVRVVSHPDDFNFAKLNNYAFSFSTGQAILLLNNDIQVLHANWLAKMTELIQHPQVGAVGARLLYPQGTIQHAGIGIDEHGGAWHLYFGESLDYPDHHHDLSITRQVSANTGACLLIRREVWEAVGGIDENFAVLCNDVDLCLRIGEAGWKVLWTPNATLVHHESATLGRPSRSKLKQYKIEKDLFAKRWKDYRDPWHREMTWPFSKTPFKEILRSNRKLQN